jgi:hypothetical protein
MLLTNKEIEAGRKWLRRVAATDTDSKMIREAGVRLINDRLYFQEAFDSDDTLLGAWENACLKRHFSEADRFIRVYSNLKTLELPNPLRRDVLWAAVSINSANIHVSVIAFLFSLKNQTTAYDWQELVEILDGPDDQPDLPDAENFLSRAVVDTRRLKQTAPIETFIEASNDIKRLYKRWKNDEVCDALDAAIETEPVPVKHRSRRRQRTRARQRAEQAAELERLARGIAQAIVNDALKGLCEKESGDKNEENETTETTPVAECVVQEPEPECVYCFQELGTRDRMAFRCGHSRHCVDCYEKAVRRGHTACPTCRVSGECVIRVRM